MYNIYDYLNNYKDVTLDEVSWNMVDNLLCSILSYSKIPAFKEKKNIKDYCKLIIDTDVPNKGWYMAKQVQDIAKILINSKRYEDMIFYNYVYQLDENTQFSALSIKIKKIKIISFEGSDGTTIGWYENMKLSYMYPTYTQKLATDYLKDAINKKYEKLYVLGHSKGGNLAMSGAMLLDDKRFNRITKVINFDGPGFLKEQFNSKEYKKLKTKLINVLPEKSYVGSLMYNDGEEIVVRTDAHGINVHFPNTWEVFGTKLIGYSLDSRGMYLRKVTSTGFDDIDRNEAKNVVDIMFKKLLEKYDSTIHVSPKEVLGVLESASRNNLQISKVVLKVMSVLFFSSAIGSKIKVLGRKDDGSKKNNEDAK